jgi:hypothetical protein
MRPGCLLPSPVHFSLPPKSAAILPGERENRRVNRRNADDLDHFAEGYRKAGLPE